MAQLDTYPQHRRSNLRFHAEFLDRTRAPGSMRRRSPNQRLEGRCPLGKRGYRRNLIVHKAAVSEEMLIAGVKVHDGQSISTR